MITFIHFSCWIIVLILLSHQIHLINKTKEILLKIISFPLLHKIFLDPYIFSECIFAIEFAEYKGNNVLNHQTLDIIFKKYLKF